MKTVTLQELNEHRAGLLEWIDAGEEVAISRQGTIIARLIPEKSAAFAHGAVPPVAKVDWTTSAAFTMDRSQLPEMTAEQVSTVLSESRGNW